MDPPCAALRTLVHCRIPSTRRRSQSLYPSKVRQNGSFYFVSRPRLPVRMCMGLTCRVASAEVSLCSVKHVGRGWVEWCGGSDGAWDEVGRCRGVGIGWEDVGRRGGTVTRRRYHRPRRSTQFCKFGRRPTKDTMLTRSKSPCPRLCSRSEGPTRPPERPSSRLPLRPRR